MKDIMGKEVKVGDFVVVNRKHYRQMIFAIIQKITPKNISVQYWNGNYMETYMTPEFVRVNDDEICRIPNEVLQKLDPNGNSQFSKFVENGLNKAG